MANDILLCGCDFDTADLGHPSRCFAHGRHSARPAPNHILREVVGGSVWAYNDGLWRLAYPYRLATPPPPIPERNPARLALHAATAQRKDQSTPAPTPTIPARSQARGLGIMQPLNSARLSLQPLGVRTLADVAIRPGSRSPLTRSPSPISPFSDSGRSADSCHYDG